MTITNVLNHLGADGEQVTPVFITVDPTRDTPEAIRAYLANFHPRMLGLSGSEAEIKRATDAYKVYASKGAPEPEGGYMMDHSGFIYLMDKEGKYLAHFRHSDPEQRIVDAIRPHL
jgi:protein SCO1/2